MPLGQLNVSRNFWNDDKMAKVCHLVTFYLFGNHLSDDRMADLLSLSFVNLWAFHHSKYKKFQNSFNGY